MSPEQAAQRAADVRRALALEWATLAWVAIEALVAIAAGVSAGSLVLLAFGFDSVIEMGSAGVLVWRLVVELRRGKHFGHAAEKTAARINGGFLLLLAGYIVAGAAWKLSSGQDAAVSWPGFAVAAVAIPVMYLLGRLKLRLAERLGSAALRADAAESLTCLWLSGVVVVTVLVHYATGMWWVDAVGSLGIVWFVLREGWEALSGED